MIATFMRGGWNRHTVHLAGCPRCNRIARALGWAVPWKWADEQPAGAVVTAIHTARLRTCSLCRPMSRLLPRKART